MSLEETFLNTLRGTRLTPTYLESLVHQGVIAAYSISDTSSGEKEYRIRLGFPATHWRKIGTNGEWTKQSL